MLIMILMSFGAVASATRARERAGWSRASELPASRSRQTQTLDLELALVVMLLSRLLKPR